MDNLKRKREIGEIVTKTFTKNQDYMYTKDRIIEVEYKTNQLLTIIDTD